MRSSSIRIIRASATGLQTITWAMSFKVFGLWQPVFFHGGHTWAEKIIGGWNFSGIFNWHTGFPWSPLFVTGSAGSPAGSLYCSTCGYSQLLPGAYLGGAGHNTGNAAFKSGPGVGNGVNANFPKAAANPNGALAYFAPPAFRTRSHLPSYGRSSSAKPRRRAQFAAWPTLPGPGRDREQDLWHAAHT